MEILILLIVIFSIWLILYLQNSKKKDAEKQALIKRRIEFTQEYFDNINKQKVIPFIATHLLLKKDETAYLSDMAMLLEMGKYTISNRGGGAVSVARGIYIGGTSGKSRSYDELRQKDSGELVLTNKRLIFDGQANTREIPLEKILSVANHFDAIEIACEGKVKSFIFSDINNPILWKALIHYIRAIPESGELPTMDLQIND